MSAFTVLAEPSRRQLLDAMLDGPLPVNDLVAAVDMSQPVVSRHLKILRDAGFVTVQPDGQRRLYSINPEPMREVDAWLEPYRRFWSVRLDALGHHLDALEDKERS